MTLRRPDSSTVINHGQRLILNRDGVRAVATLAQERGHVAPGWAGAYLAGVTDALNWLAGDAPDPDLQRFLGIDPAPARRHP